MNNILSVDLNGLKLKNPVITASGTFGFGKELVDYFPPDNLGAITVKGLTRRPSAGNKNPRIAETPSGILNSIGLENPGIENFIDHELKEIKKLNSPIIANISGHSIDDFLYMAEKLAPYDEIAAIELNVSCPNIEGGGMVFGTDSELIYQITEKVKGIYNQKVIVKLTPNVTDIVEMALAAEEGGADIISLINTLLGMSIDIEKEKPELGNVFGGLSGPAVKPVALRMVYQVSSVVEIPIIGMGGIMNGKDALEFIYAGASAVGVGTATLIDPTATMRIIKEMKDWLEKKEINNISNIIGKAKV